MNVAHAPIFDFLVHIMLVRRSKTLIFLYFQKLRYLTSAFDRPSFRQMEQMIEAGEVGTVIVKDDCVIIELNAESPIKCGFCAVSSIF